MFFLQARRTPRHPAFFAREANWNLVNSCSLYQPGTLIIRTAEEVPFIQRIIGQRPVNELDYVFLAQKHSTLSKRTVIKRSLVFYLHVLHFSGQAVDMENVLAALSNEKLVVIIANERDPANCALISSDLIVRNAIEFFKVAFYLFLFSLFKFFLSLNRKFIVMLPSNLLLYIFLNLYSSLKRFLFFLSFFKLSFHFVSCKFTHLEQFLKVASTGHTFECLAIPIQS